MHTVQVARLVGASPIIAVGPLTSARERALALGADHALAPTTEDVGARVREFTDGRMLDVAVDLVGANAALGALTTPLLIGVKLVTGPGSWPGPPGRSSGWSSTRQLPALRSLADLPAAPPTGSGSTGLAPAVTAG